MQPKIDCGEGYTAEVNATRVHLYKDGVWCATTDHSGAIVRVAATADRDQVTVRAVAGVRASKPATATRSAVVAVKPAPRARNWRCPNPRDCGDPSCDGNCGY